VREAVPSLAEHRLKHRQRGFHHLGSDVVSGKNGNLEIHGREKEEKKGKRRLGRPGRLRMLRRLRRLRRLRSLRRGRKRLTSGVRGRVRQVD
jgi:hypothetical protein